MKRHLFIASVASLAVFATPLLATGAMAKHHKAASHHMKQAAKTTPSTAAPTSTSTSKSATPAATPATPAPTKK